MPIQHLATYPLCKHQNNKNLYNVVKQIPKIQQNTRVMSLIINNIQLINEVKKRPILYKTDIKNCNNRQIRLKLWLQICQKILPQWDQMSTTERLLRRKEVQSRWTNLRYCFWRDFNIQKSQKLYGQPDKKRKWLFFNRLSFLLTPEQKQSISHSDNSDHDDDDEDVDLLGDNCIENNDKDVSTLNTTSTTTQTQATMTTFDNAKTTSSTITTKRPDLCVELTDSIKENHGQDEKSDEERLFLLSLVPLLSKFNDEQKYVAKTEILNVLRQIQLFQYTIKTNPMNYNLINKID